MNKLWLAFLPFLFVSCATITRGVHDKLYVESQPPGAEVTLSTGEKGITPAKFIKKRRDSFSLTVSKQGYESQTVKIESKASPTGGAAMAGNVVAGGIIGIGVDAGSGAMFSLYPNPVSVRLIPRSKPPTRKVPPKRKVSTKKRTTQEVELEPRTSRPQSPPEPPARPPEAAPSPPPTEPRTLESVEPPKASPTP